MTIKKYLFIFLGINIALILILVSVNFFTIKKITLRNENIININKSAQLLYNQKNTIINYLRVLEKKDVLDSEENELSLYEEVFGQICDENTNILDSLTHNLKSEEEKSLLQTLIDDNLYLKNSFSPIKENFLTSRITSENRKLSILSIVQKRENIKNYLLSNKNEDPATSTVFLFSVFSNYENFEKLESTFLSNTNKNNLDKLQASLSDFERTVKQESLFSESSLIFFEIIKYRNELDSFYINHLTQNSENPSLESELKKIDEKLKDYSLYNESVVALVDTQKKWISFLYKFAIIFNFVWVLLFFACLFLLAYFFLKIIALPIKKITSLSEIINEGKEIKEKDIKSTTEIKELFKSLLDIKNKQLIVKKDLDDKMNEIKSKENIESLIEALNDGVLMYDSNKKVILINSSLKRILGINTSDVNLKNLNSIFAKSNLDFHIDLSLKTKDLYKIENVEILGRTYEVAITQVSSYRDEIVGGAIVFHETLSDKNHRKDSSDNMNLEPVISSHFGTPLSYIKLFTEILNAGEIGELNKEQKETISNINRSTIEMKSIVDKLKQISILENEDFKINSENIHIVPFIKNLIKEFCEEKSLRETDFVFNNMIPEGMQIAIDKNIFSKALKTILDNAVTYNSDEGLVINVGIKELGFNYLVSVKDGGIGIPEEDKNLIFEKFFKASNSLTKNSKGSGLSLHLTKKELNAVGAELFFESREGYGSTFFIEIPKGGMRK